MGGVIDFVSNPLGQLFGVDDSAGDQPAAPPTPETPTIEASGTEGDTGAPEEAQIRQRRRGQQRSLLSGRRSSILTSPLGLTEPATTSRRQLLGR